MRIENPLEKPVKVSKVKMGMTGEIEILFNGKIRFPSYLMEEAKAPTDNENKK